MSDYRTTGIPEKKYFNPSTIENIDHSIYDYITKLNLSVDTNDGPEKVPVLWGTSERAFLSKTDRQVRDSQGMLKLPLISIKRSNVQKSLPSKGVFQGTVFENDDEQGGSLVVSRVINQEKTRAYAKSTAQKSTQDSSYPIKNSKIVYQTISAPMPVNVEISYEITLRTEYQQQMNNLMLPFITNPGTINYIKLENDGHRYEGFIEGQFSSKSNLSDYSNDERKFETMINIRVVGYLVGQGNNREKPHYSVRENFVEVKIPKESVIIDPNELEKYGL
tara:strand:+ start:2185 stop:3015 length:831 start_codon:yes stop_codon:yes gene_type:complete